MSDNRDFINKIKNSITIISVNINDSIVKIPITYSMSASEKYQNVFEETNDVRASFFKMVFHIITSYWKVAFETESEPNVTYEDLLTLSDSDLEKIYVALISKVGYFADMETQLNDELSDVCDKFFQLHKMEYEKYRVELSKLSKSISKSRESLNIKNMLTPSLQQLAATQIALQKSFALQNFDQIAKAARLANSIDFSAVAAAQASVTSQWAAAASQINAIRPQLNRIQECIRKSFPPVDSFQNLINASAFTTMKSALSVNNSFLNVIDLQQKSFTNALKSITRFNYNGKLIELSALAQELARNIRPFLLDINTINFERFNLEDFLLERCNALQKFGWWFMGELPMDIGNYIYSNRDSLTQDEVDTIICNFFEQDNFKELDSMTSRWFNVGCFIKASKQLSTGIRHHKSGDYISSIPILTPQVEGLIRTFMADIYQIQMYRFDPVMKQFKDKMIQVDEYITAYAMALIDGFFGDFKPNCPDDTPDFNRNKISHGLAFNYDTRAASLKLILFLNEIFEIINALSTKST